VKIAPTFSYTSKTTLPVLVCVWQIQKLRSLPSTSSGPWRITFMCSALNIAPVFVLSYSLLMALCLLFRAFVVVITSMDPAIRRFHFFGLNIVAVIPQPVDHG
jgi:hypothetical protein